MKKALLCILTVLFLYSIMSQLIWLTLVILPLGIYLEKQDLFHDWDEKRRQARQAVQERRKV